MLAWWESLDALARGFAFVAFPATALLLIQTVLTLLGLGHDADADMDLTIDIDGDGVPDIPDISAADAASIGDQDAGVGAGLQLFSLRGIIAFFAVGGWAGLAFLRSGMDRGLAVLLAVASGALAMVLTALILKSFLRLQYNGTLDVRNAVGLSGTVYLTIPPARSEAGKVTLLLQERLTQLDAVTDREAPIKTGAEVIVVGISGKTTLIVQPKS
ncbi:NfeD family protein [bacterium]|nr:NfeD family protein [bacterium]